MVSFKSSGAKPPRRPSSSSGSPSQEDRGCCSPRRHPHQGEQEALKYHAGEERNFETLLSRMLVTQQEESAMVTTVHHLVGSVAVVRPFCGFQTDMLLTLCTASAGGPSLLALLGIPFPD